MPVLKDSHTVRRWHSSPRDVFISLSYTPSSSVHLLIHIIMPCFCVCSTPAAESCPGTSIRAELVSVFNMYNKRRPHGDKWGICKRPPDSCSNNLRGLQMISRSGSIHKTELLLHYDFGGHYMENVYAYFECFMDISSYVIKNISEEQKRQETF